MANKSLKNLSVAAALILTPLLSYSQGDNEIQVYASPCVEPGTTMVELHSNYTPHGSNELADPKSAHWLNETVEITHGFGPNFEVGLYTFTGVSPDGRYQYLGNQLRPRVTAPDRWHLPVGASISAEFGFFRPEVGADFYGQGEIRPIVDKTINNWYFAFNPSIGFELQPDHSEAFFEPQLKAVYTIHQTIGVGIEYYSNLGSLSGFETLTEQEHLFGPAIDLYVDPNWEVNIGYLKGLTNNSNQDIFKVILGRRFGGKKAP